MYATNFNVFQACLCKKVHQQAWLIATSLLSGLPVPLHVSMSPRLFTNYLCDRRLIAELHVTSNSAGPISMHDCPAASHVAFRSHVVVFLSTCSKLHFNSAEGDCNFKFSAQLNLLTDVNELASGQRGLCFCLRVTSLLSVICFSY